MRPQIEKDLHHILAGCPQLASLGCCVATGLSYGVLVSLGAHPVGLWSRQDDGLVFRELASYEPTVCAASLPDAHVATIKLLKACRHGWAERTGAVDVKALAA